MKSVRYSTFLVGTLCVPTTSGIALVGGVIRGELEDVDVTGVSLDVVFSSSIEEQKITVVYVSVLDMRESIHDILTTKDDKDAYIGYDDDDLYKRKYKKYEEEKTFYWSVAKRSS